MALFDDQSSSNSPGGLGPEELLVSIDDSAHIKGRSFKSLQRTMSTPSPGRSFKSSTFPSRPIYFNKRGSRSLRFNTTPSRRTSSRSLRSISSPSRKSFLANRKHRYSALKQNTSSTDFKFRANRPLANHRSNHQQRSVDQLDVSSNNVSNLSLSSQLTCHRVGRSISSPENLHPQLLQSTNRNDFPYFSPSSSGRLLQSSQTQSHNLLNAHSTNFSTYNFLQASSISFGGDSSTDRSVPNLCSFTPGISSSLGSSLYSSGQSIRGGLDNESISMSVVASHTTDVNTSLWHSDLNANLRLQSGLTSERRFSQLALAHLTSRDLSAIHFHSPPPSYDKLCNPESLPTYQEALEGERREPKMILGHSRVFTLPTVPDYNPSNTDPLIEDNDQNFNVGLLSSPGADLTESDEGYTTILDAIPCHLERESGPKVPIRFIPRWSLRRLKCRSINSPCITSLCNKDLVKKEINRRWPFIVSVLEDLRCPGLLLIECSSNLTVAQLPDSLPQSANGLMSEQFFPSSNDIPEPPAVVAANSITRSDGSIRSPADAINIEETNALNNHVMFYMCGKCVTFDSFDAENVRTHIDYDCTGPVNKWANISEMYLVIRASCFILIIICVFMWLPLNGWI